MELFESIRREERFGETSSVRGLARQFGVHRRLVRQALASAIPPERKAASRPKPKLGGAVERVRAMLVADQSAPRKQRHTAHRIWARLREEAGCTAAESTVRQLVRQLRRELGTETRETYVPQSYGWGAEAQVDWYEAEVEIAGERVKRQFLSLRSMASAGAFHISFERATQQAFLEGQEAGFRYFGGVFARLRYDNLASAVKKVLRGYEREQSERFIAFRSHWGFAAEFCNPARGNEKGGVEGEVGRFRRNHLVPVPSFANDTELNAYLLDCCRRDEGRRAGERPMTVGAAMGLERPHLLPLAVEGFPLTEHSWARVDGKGCVKVKGNWYSAPLAAGTEVRTAVSAVQVALYAGPALVAEHRRCYEHGRQILELEHYLEVLWRKPGALAGATALAQWRQQGRWPASYDRLWRSFEERLGKAAGTRALIGLLELGRQVGYGRLQAAVERALDLGLTDPAAVWHLAGQPQAAPPPLSEAGRWARYERPQPGVAEYDQLLSAGAMPGGVQ